MLPGSPSIGDNFKKGPGEVGSSDRSFLAAIGKKAFRPGESSKHAVAETTLGITDS